MNIKRLKEIPKSRLIKKLIGFDEIYSIAFRQKGKSLFEENNEPFQIIPNANGFWYADPLLCRLNEKDFLFIEAYDRKHFRGHIQVAELVGETGKNIVFQKAIEEDYHMSFPMVFEWNGKVFMIPETSENHSINLYESVDFPLRWKMINSYDTGEKGFVDTVIIEQAPNSITLLTSEYKNDNPLMVRFQKFRLEWNNLEDLIPDEFFNSKQVFNYTDRNAGKPFEFDGQIFLPTQVSSTIDYGVEIQLRKKQEDEYVCFSNLNKEKIKILGIKKKEIIGVHTFSCNDAYEIADVRYLKFSPLYQMLKLRH